MRNALAGMFVLILTSCGGADSPSVEENNLPTSFMVSTSTIGSGNISPNQLQIEEGKSATFEIIPEDGSFIREVSGCEGTLTATTFTVSNIKGECTITATFIENDESLAPTAEIIFPTGQSKTDRSSINVKGIAKSPNAIKAIFVNGIEAEIIENSANNDVTWQVDLTLKENSFNQLTVETVSTNGHIDKVAAQAQISTIQVPDSFTVDNFNHKFLAKTIEGLQIIDLAGNENDFIESSQYSIEGDWACCANKLTYSNYSNSLIFTTLFDGKLNLFSQNLQTGDISTLDKIDLALDPNTYRYARLKDIEYHHSTNSVFMSILYINMADYYSSKVELLKYDLDTLQFEFIETGGLKYNGTLIAGKFSIVNTSLYYIFGDSVILLDLLSDYEGPIAQIWPNTLIANFNVHSVSKQLVYSRYDGIGVLDLNTNQDTFFETDQHELDFVQIRDTAIDELNNRVFIGDSGLDMVLQFDLSSNVLEPYIMNGVGTGQRMITPREITANNLHNTIYVLDDSDGVSGSIISVNLSTGERTEIIDIGKSEDILVDEEKQFLYVLSIHSISKIDLATLEQTIVSDNAQPNSGELFDQASGFALDTKNNRLLVTDRMRSSLFSVDIETGFRTIIAMEFGDNPPGESSAVDVEFDTEKDMAYVLSQSLGMIFSVDLMTNEKNEFLTSCPMSDGREGLNKEDWALQNLAIEQSNRQLYVTTEDTILKIAIDTKDCQAPISGEPFFAFDVAVNDKGQVFGSYFNSLSQFDFESEQQVIISK